MKTTFAFWIGTVGYIGKLPLAPGTWGTLSAIPLAWLNFFVPWPFQIGEWILLLIIGTWSAFYIERSLNKPDASCIVIDEVLGFLICTAFWSSQWWHLILGFFLFRILDILKLPPTHWMDQLSHTSTSAWMRAASVLLDDAIAGFQGLGIFYLLSFWNLL